MMRMPMTCCLIVLVTATSGCPKTLEVEYAVSRGASINGSSTFLSALRDAGHNVESWPFLSSRLEHGYDAVIVMHDGFGPPSPDALDGLDLILDSPQLKSLVIVPRDSDAAIEYWEYIAGSGISGDKKAEVEQALSRHRADLQFDTAHAVSLNSADWYGYEVVTRDEAADTLDVQIAGRVSGESAVEAQWPLTRRLLLAPGSTILWSSGDDPLLASEAFYGTTVFVLASAAPILNGGLVDPGNRLLAEDLIGRLGESKHIGFVTSSRWVNVADTPPSRWAFLKVQPYPWIFGHLIAVLLMFCWWKFPIFGRPKTETMTENRRFGRHVEAVGGLLSRTRKPSHAIAIIREWQKTHSSHRTSNEEL